MDDTRGLPGKGFALGVGFRGTLTGTFGASGFLLGALLLKAAGFSGGTDLLDSYIEGWVDGCHDSLSLVALDDERGEARVNGVGGGRCGRGDSGRR
ncbi:hypothetical protein Lsed01_00844 [Demequina sediminis]|uniref:Uncharacterized protein n=1 Tax=Demequina sediminis TaxID=1930058 RepID=A0ABP9WF05_9MICO